MITFNFTLTTRYEQWHNDKTFNVLEYEGNFEIIINSTIFFSEPHFIILEFLRDAMNWLNCKDKAKEMLYNCIETEDNPLISFTRKNDKWFISSPWQKYKSDAAFTRKELETVVIDLECKAKEQLNK